jgi:DNA-binding ferritin-like protein (Dps family)
MIFTTIKEEYQSTKTSFKKLAKKHQIHYKKIERMAKKEGWIKYDPTKAPTTNIQTIEPPQKTIKQTESIQSIGTTEKEVIEKLRGEIKGEWGKAFFDSICEEMKGKFYLYDYFTLLLASNFYQTSIDARKKASKKLLSVSGKNGTKYVSAEYNLHISATAQFIKLIRQLGITPMVRQKAHLRALEKVSNNTVFNPKPNEERNMKI